MAFDPTSVRPRLSRRDLFRTTAAAAIAVGTQAAPFVPPQTGGQKSVMGMPFEPRANVRMALIGCGERGSGMLKEFLGVDGVRHRRVRRGEGRRSERPGRRRARRPASSGGLRQRRAATSRTC